jgi:hypothetical protein
VVKRLIEKGLMFGNLIPVDSPVLVERYRRAMKHLTGRETKLEDFHIDISGYSPEIGDELGDDLYLNPKGVNRQFILLTLDQRKAPLLNAHFSTSRAILRQFIDQNERQLFALTARDAVAGELVTSLHAVETVDDLFALKQVTVEADTTGGTVATADRLARLIDRFKTEKDAWTDDVLIAEMIGLAKVTGDLTRNPVNLKAMTFRQGNFWTAHFGGVYLFQDVAEPAAILATDKRGFGKLPIGAVMDFTDRTRIAQFLQVNDLAEPIVEARGSDAAAILQQKMDFILVDVAGAMGEDLTGATRRDLRAVARRHAERLPPEWQALAALVRWAAEGGPWPRISSEHPAYFYTLRAKPRPDADLVNMLLAELSPLDFRQLFICHKEAFYAAWRRWPPAKQDWAAEFLAGEYMIDKAGTRAALFGAEEAMEEPVTPVAGPWGRAAAVAPPPPPRPDPAMIDAVGPWGAVRKR